MGLQVAVGDVEQVLVHHGPEDGALRLGPGVEIVHHHWAQSSDKVQREILETTHCVPDDIPPKKTLFLKFKISSIVTIPIAITITVVIITEYI